MNEDPEIAALIAIVKALHQLDLKAQRRVLWWAWERLASDESKAAELSAKAVDRG